MKKSINDIVEIAARDDINVITVSEVTHFSYNSHTFHFELMKKLVARDFNLLSSEILTPIDALLMNAWIDNKLTCSIDYLYESILQTGGMGTYRWIRYIKRNNLKMRFVGCDPDQGFIHKIGFAAAMKRLLSAEFFAELSLQVGGRFRPGGGVVDFARIVKYIKTSTDKYVYDAIKQTYTMRIEERLTIWCENIIRQLPVGAKLFCNGYHLGKNEIGGELSRHCNILTIGLGSLNKEVYYLPITKYFLKKHNISTANYRKLGTLEENDRDFIAFWNAFNELQVNSHDKWIGRSIQMNHIFEPTKLELESPTYKLLPTVVDGTSIGRIDHYGYAPIPFMTGPKIKNNGYVDVGDYYQYVIFLTRSCVTTNLYL